MEGKSPGPSKVVWEPFEKEFDNKRLGWCSQRVRAREWRHINLYYNEGLQIGLNKLIKSGKPTIIKNSLEKHEKTHICERLLNQ